ncbi:MAG: sulfatase-like hydrolase/transferase [Chloroflexi bacterium]|nr:sulfatase-like hydrolase/transferase [Chloroflexota bacterium]
MPNHKPNIVWIYCDELRTDALECYGNRYGRMHTPNIDSIASRGVLFENSFVNSPVCVSSRTSTLTGLYPEDTGVYNNEAAKAEYRLPQNHETFPEVFARHGYTTANFGKVHLPPGLNAWMHSDEDGGEMQPFYEGVSREELDIIHVPNFPYIVIGGRYPGDRPYPADPVTRNAIRWLRTAPEPFFMRLSYLQPHTPVLPPPPFDRFYDSLDFPDALTNAQPVSKFEARFREIVGTDKLTPEQIRRIHVEYYGLVAWLDAQIGQFLSALREAKRLDNTIIVFESDHGTSLGEGGRLQKLTFAPEVLRVPRIIAWPGVIPAGQRRADIAEGVDLARTLLSFADIPAPDHLRGRSLFTDPAPEAVHATVGYGYTSSRTFPSSAQGTLDYEHGWPRRTCIRTRRFRFEINTRINGEAPPSEQEDAVLVDLVIDPDETVNLADDPRYSEVRQTLRSLLDVRTQESYTPPEHLTTGRYEMK